jgi:hypothetical protein
MTNDSSSNTAMVVPLDPNKPAKLTNWTKEPSLSDLKYDMEQATQSHTTQMGKIKLWNDLMAVTGSAKPVKVKGRSSVQPKLIRRQAEWRYSALTEPFLGTSKLFKVSPTTFEDPKAAAQNELLLNWQFRTKINRVSFIDDYVRSTVDEGTCIVRVGWDRKTKKVKEQAPVYSYYPVSTQDAADLLQAAVGLMESDPRTYNEETDPVIKAAVDYFIETGEPVIAVEESTTEIEVEKVLVNKPTVLVMNPDNIIIDPSCNGDIEKAMFAVVSFETCKADLEAEGNRYSNLDKVNWENGAPVSDAAFSGTNPNALTGMQFKDAARKKVVAYEYWGFYDIKGNDILVPIVATWVGNVMIRMEKNPFPDQKIPFVLVKYLPVKRELYGEPDAELLSDNQAILGAVTRGMIDVLGRSANGQQGFAKGMLDPLNRRRFDNGQDYEFNPTAHPSMGMIEHKYPELPQSALAMLGLQNQEAEALTGVKSFGGGLSGESYGDVAAGIRGALDAASKREMAILRRLAKGMSDIGTKLTKMNALFLSDVEVVRVTNTTFVEVKREDIQGEFDLEVDISTAEVDDAKSKDLAFMLQTIGPKGDPAMTMMILAEIAELKRMPELANKLRNFKPSPPSEQEIKMGELEVAKLEAEVDEIRSRAEGNRAKAKRDLALADQADLDFIEQETGTKHARSMEAQKAQSEGNQNLQITKSLLAPQKKEETAPNVEAAIGFNRVSDTLNKDPYMGEPQGLPEMAL